MSLIVQAWQAISPKPFPYRTILQYSGRFSDFNGNIRLSRDMVTVSLSNKWKEISTDLQLGMIQHLLCRLFKVRAQTTQMDLYHSFMKHAHTAAEKTENDPVLEESFHRVNENFFAGIIEKPNLAWSSGNRRLGAYHYGSDRLTLSTVLAQDLELLDYVMYHELLHKKHKYSSTSLRATYHSTAFRADEAKFPNAAILERRLSRLGSMG